VRCVLLVATDGVYDMVSNDRAIDVAFKHWGDPAGAAKELVAEAGKALERHTDST
jgi:serine/threonine protein phosphatase PrpC